MAWKRTDPMEERIRFVMETLSGVFRMSELSDRYGVSRKTGYKWLQRYREGGVDGTPGSESGSPPVPASYCGNRL